MTLGVLGGVGMEKAALSEGQTWRWFSEQSCGHADLGHLGGQPWNSRAVGGGTDTPDWPEKRESGPNLNHKIKSGWWGVRKGELEVGERR